MASEAPFRPASGFVSRLARSSPFSASSPMPPPENASLAGSAFRPEWTPMSSEPAACEPEADLLSDAPFAAQTQSEQIDALLARAKGGVN